MRGVVGTEPFMHSGELKTLEDVVAFYNRGGDLDGFSGTKDPLMVPLNLTNEEQAQLVAFLKTLNGGDEINPALLADTSATAGTAYCP